MRKSFNTLTIILLALMGTLLVAQAFGHAGRGASGESRQDEKQEWERLRRRFTEEYVGYLSSGIWTLTHSDASRSELEESLKLLQVLGNALDRNDPALLDEVGGVKGFKERFLRLMKSGGDAVSGFAATVLAVSGDSSYAPQIAALLEKRDASFADGHAHPATARGRAARALEFLGAKEYAPRIATLLRSKNNYDRAGAAIALCHLGAKEYARDVARLLTTKDFIPRDGSAIYSLVQMGVAADYKKEIAHVLNNEINGEVVEAAAYALARLRAKEYMKDIARLLGDRFRKGHAAKALAFMGAKEYAGEIALMLSDESQFNRQDALLALGILRAKEYAPQAAKLLNAESDGALEGVVSDYAAASLVLMGAVEYAGAAVPLLEKRLQFGAFLDEESFHPLVREEAIEINKRFKASLAQMSSQKK